MKRMDRSAWMWYPGDFEIWLRRDVELRRDERLVVTPPIWRVDAPYSTVRFRKTWTAKQPETIDFISDGSLRLVINGVTWTKPTTGVALEAGRHEIVAYVANIETFPALYVQGETDEAGERWTVSHLEKSGFLPAATGTFRDPSSPPSAFRLRTELRHPSSTVKNGNSLFVDFGQETFGFVRLSGVHGTGDVRLQYGESPDEANDEAFCETYDFVTIGEGHSADGAFISPRSRAFRYVKVVPQGDVEIDSVSMLYEYLPVEYRGSFECSDELVNRIYEMSLYTFHLNTREFFLDGIKRDRWVWSGDAYQSYLMNYYSFFEQDATRRTIVALRGKDPVEEHLNTILDYSFYWFLGMEDYYRYTNDLPFIRSQYDKMKSLMAFCVSRTNGDGLVEGLDNDWVFVDWADMGKEGELTFEQLLFCMSLESMSKFAELFGDMETANKYRPMAEKLRRTIRETFWDSERCAFVHRRWNGRLDPLVTKHPNIFALMYGFLSPEERTRIKTSVIRNPNVPAIKTPYMRFYELAAMCEVGEHSFVLQEMRSYWGGMISLGATSFWEEYDPYVPVPEQYAMYDRPYGKSLCHAWGASPIYLLGKYYMGVTPEEPGYAKTRIEPHLGDLEWMRGKVPTPNGDVQVEMDRSTIKVTLPHGTGVLRFASSIVPFTTGGVIVTIGEGIYELAIEEARIAYEVRYSR